MGFHIYKITNLINQKYYIGRTKTSIKQRWSVHLAHAKKDYKRKGGSIMGPYIRSAMKKYGVENFAIHEIAETNSFENMVFLEKFYIKFYDSINPKYGYNLIIDSYGDGLEFISESTSNKISVASHNNSMGDNPGVYWSEDRKKWCMRIRNRGKGFNRRFNDKLEAQETYDKLAFYLYGEDTFLYFPEKAKEYKVEDLEELINTFYKKRNIEYSGVRKDKAGGYTVRVGIGSGNRLYIGYYIDKKDAAIVYDKVLFYLNKKNPKYNFPELISPAYLKEGKKIYNFFSDPQRQRKLVKGKSSQYNGVCKRSARTWEMGINYDTNCSVREVHPTEKEAAISHDNWIIKLGLNKNKLNFPEKELL